MVRRDWPLELVRRCANGDHKWMFRGAVVSDAKLQVLGSRLESAFDIEVEWSQDPTPEARSAGADWFAYLDSIGQPASVTVEKLTCFICGGAWVRELGGPIRTSLPSDGTEYSRRWQPPANQQLQSTTGLPYKAASFDPEGVSKEVIEAVERVLKDGRKFTQQIVAEDLGITDRELRNEVGQLWKPLKKWAEIEFS